MRSLLLLIYLTTLTIAAVSQNLVPNPGFEEHKLDSVFYWEQTNKPYYHFEFNTLKAHSGNCMNGLCIWESSSSEYLQIKLNSPLEKNKKYIVTAYTMINPSNLGNHIDTINYLGIYFSKEKFAVSSKNILFFKPHVYLDIYQDSIWNKTEGTYTAKGDESYMLVGHFYELSNSIMQENDTAYEIVFKEITNLESEQSELIKSEISKIEERYKKAQQDSWNIDKVKSQRKREKLIKAFKVSMYKKRLETQEVTLDINNEYAKRINELYYKNEISTKSYSGNSLIRLYFDDFSVSPAPDAIVIKEKIIPLKNVFFNTGKSDLLPESFYELDNQVKFLNANPDIAIEVSGHTDNVGTETENQTLSENRAKAVADYLIKKGIQTSRVKYKGYGSSKPVSSNDTKEGQAKNRRVEITILEN